MVCAAQSLLLEYLYTQKDERVLALEGGSGWLAVEAAHFVPDGWVLSLDRDIRNVDNAKNLLATIPNANTTQDVIPTTNNWDIVLLTIPKERRFARTLLLAAWEALKPGGKLLLAGPTKSGAKAVIKDAERLFGGASVLGYRNHQRVAACTRGEILPDSLPEAFQQTGIAPGTRYFVELNHPEGSIKLETHPGIFSWEAIDEGTALLLEHLKIEPGAHVWDVGCGYGAIGISAILSGAAFAAMSDINLIAVDYTQKNAITNGLDLQVDIFPADSPTRAVGSSDTRPCYDIIISNPAFHQGRKINKSMADQLILHAPDFLQPEGCLLIVANRFLNYDKFMRERFKHVSRIAETSKFHVIEARNG